MAIGDGFNFEPEYALGGFAGIAAGDILGAGGPKDMLRAAADPLNIFGMRSKSKNTSRSGQYNDLGIEMGQKNYAAKTQAAITRANWARSKGQLRPIIDRLNYTYFNQDGRREATQGAATMAVDGVNQAQQQFGRDARSMGMSLAPDQQAEVSRQFDVAKNTSKLDAMNRASRGYDDMKNQIALG